MAKRVMRSNRRTQRRRGSQFKQRKKRSKLLKRTLRRTLKRRNSFRKKNTYKRRKTNMRRGGRPLTHNPLVRSDDDDEEIEGEVKEGEVKEGENKGAFRAKVRILSNNIKHAIINYHQKGHSAMAESVRILIPSILELLNMGVVIEIKKNKSLVCIVDNAESKISILKIPRILILNPECRTGFQKAYYSFRERLPGDYSRPRSSIKIEELLSMRYRGLKGDNVSFFGRSTVGTDWGKVGDPTAGTDWGKVGDPTAGTESGEVGDPTAGTESGKVEDPTQA